MTIVDPTPAVPRRRALLPRNPTPWAPSSVPPTLPPQVQRLLQQFGGSAYRTYQPFRVLQPLLTLDIPNIPGISANFTPGNVSGMSLNFSQANLSGISATSGQETSIVPGVSTHVIQGTMRVPGVSNIVDQDTEGNSAASSFGTSTNNGQGNSNTLSNSNISGNLSISNIHSSSNIQISLNNPGLSNNPGSLNNQVSSNNQGSSNNPGSSNAPASQTSRSYSVTTSRNSPPNTQNADGVHTPAPLTSLCRSSLLSQFGLRNLRKMLAALRAPKCVAKFLSTITAEECVVK